MRSRDLNEIIEDCKLNGRPDYEELRYAVLALSAVANLCTGRMRDIYSDKDVSLRTKWRIDSFLKIYEPAFRRNPKEWLGWGHDPENPEYQRFHKIANALYEKAMRGELPNQKESNNKEGR